MFDRCAIIWLFSCSDFVLFWIVTQLSLIKHHCIYYAWILTQSDSSCSTIGDYRDIAQMCIHHTSYVLWQIFYCYSLNCGHILALIWSKFSESRWKFVVHHIRIWTIFLVPSIHSAIKVPTSAITTSWMGYHNLCSAEFCTWNHEYSLIIVISTKQFSECLKPSSFVFHTMWLSVTIT